MQLYKSWKCLIAIIGLCVCAGLLIDLQNVPRHSFSPVVEWIETKSKHVTDTTRSKEPKVTKSLPKNIKDKVRINIQDYLIGK